MHLDHPIPKDIHNLILNSFSSEWNSIYVTYEEPNVERLWRQYTDELRINLHKIHPCEKSFRHPHEWECGVWILKGSYLMTVGNEKYNYMECVFTPGSFYEMSDSHLYHNVFPLNDEPVYSVMISGPLFPYPIKYPKPTVKQSEISSERKEELLKEFKELLI